jgi:hypothetical protein
MVIILQMLISLELWDNQIGVEGALYLADALRSNTVILVPLKAFFHRLLCYIYA